MSIETWKAEFCPVEAEQATGSDIRATEHCLGKWRGLSPKNIKKHGLVKLNDRRDIQEEKLTESLEVWGENCALCLRHNTYSKTCGDCPLYKSRLNMPCYMLLPNEKNSPWGNWVKTGNAKPMIKALETTLAKLKAGKI